MNKKNIKFGLKVFFTTYTIILCIAIFLSLSLSVLYENISFVDKIEGFAISILFCIIFWLTYKMIDICERLKVYEEYIRHK